MNTPGKRSKKGVGPCGNPYCDQPKVKNSYLCKEHAADMSRIKKEIEEDPWLLYNQRSDSGIKSTEKAKIKRPKIPTCCVVGCYNERVAPSPYCFDHEGGVDD